MSQSNVKNQAAVATANLVMRIGCTTSVASAVIIGLAFGLGYLIDNWLGTSPIFLLLALVASFPVTLYVIVRLSLGSMERAQRVREHYEKQEKLNEDMEEI